MPDGPYVVVSFRVRSCALDDALWGNPGCCFSLWPFVAAVKASTLSRYERVRSSGKAFPMLQKTTLLVLAILLQGISCPPASAAEREDVRKVVNLVTSVKMPYPESLTKNRARTERVWLERGGTTTGCIGLEESIPPEGNRPEMLRIRNEPLRGVYIGALYYYVDDFDLDGLLDVGSTTQIDALDRPRRIPIANVIRFFHRGTKRGEQFQPEYQKMYDEGIQIALKYFGE